jgi:hypothetical protein
MGTDVFMFGGTHCKRVPRNAADVTASPQQAGLQ